MRSARPSRRRPRPRPRPPSGSKRWHMGAERPPTIALDGRGAERGADALIAGAREASGDGIALRVFGDAPTLAALAALVGVARPRVALLSVGEESSKGTATVVDAHAELRRAEGLTFVGNVEGNDLLAGVADVIVTDGFTGNVALKTIEGTAKTVADGVRE